MSGLLDYIAQSELAQAMADEFGVTYCVCDWMRADVASIVALPYEHAQGKGYDVLAVIEPQNAWHRGAA